jgi:hypothetical protein
MWLAAVLGGLAVGLAPGGIRGIVLDTVNGTGVYEKIVPLTPAVGVLVEC